MFKFFSKRRKNNGIDFMSLNRLRQNLDIDSDIPTVDSYTRQSQKNSEQIMELLSDNNLTFDTMRIIVNPFNLAPLVALAIFHTEKPCNLSYTVKTKSGARDFKHKNDRYSTAHSVPIIGLYPDSDNEILLELYNEDGDIIKSKTVHLKTEPLPNKYSELTEDADYPTYKDSVGDVRYFLDLPSIGDFVPSVKNRYLIASNMLCYQFGDELLPTHMFELDLLGRVYKTYYVGSGIKKIHGINEVNDTFIVSTHSDKDQHKLLEIHRLTGEVIKTTYEHDEPHTIESDISFDVLADLAGTSPVEFADSSVVLSASEYNSVGWLPAPRIFKGASVNTSDAVDLDFLKEKYNMSCCIVEDTLILKTEQNQLEEIVFNKFDRIYQISIPQDEAIKNDENLERKKFLLTIPFTEMHSGTYSVILRFSDTSQAVLADNIRLSRTRNTI